MKTIFDRLPNEVLDLIAVGLDYPATVAFRWTCRAIRSLVSAPPAHYQVRMADLVQIELWDIFDGAASQTGDLAEPLAGRDFFACYACLRIRSAIHFCNDMMSSPFRQKRSVPIGDDINYGQYRRLCIDCGIEVGLYEPGFELKFGGMEFALDGVTETGAGRGVLCKRCEKFCLACTDGDVYKWWRYWIKRLCQQCAVAEASWVEHWDISLDPPEWLLIIEREPKALERAKACGLIG